MKRFAIILIVFTVVFSFAACGGSGGGDGAVSGGTADGDEVDAAAPADSGSDAAEDSVAAGDSTAASGGGAAAYGTLDEATRIYTTGYDEIGAFSFRLPEGWKVEGKEIIAELHGDTLYLRDNTDPENFQSLTFYYLGAKSVATAEEYAALWPDKPYTSVTYGENEYLTDIDAAGDEDEIYYVLKDGAKLISWATYKNMTFIDDDIAAILGSLTIG